MDPRWALVTLLFTAALGLSLAVVLMVIMQSRTITKPIKRVWTAAFFVIFMIWLFTLGDPHSGVNLEVLYYKSIKYLPETRFTKLLQRAPNTNSVPTTNAPNSVSATNN